MSTSIRKQIRSNPGILLERLTKNVHSPQERTELKSNLDAIIEVINLEQQKVEARRQLSRKIGIAKKANEDSKPLIAEVSALSSEIDTLKQKINDQISALELDEAPTQSTKDTDHTGTLPAHMQSHVKPRSAVTTSSARANAQYETSHDTVDTTEWLAFIANNEQATAYHDPRWKSVIEGYFRHDYYLVSCREKGKLIGILPLVHVKSRLFGSFTISMPYFNYGGPIADCSATEEALLNHAAQLSATVNSEHMEIRDSKPRNNWPSTQRKVSMILPLPATDDLLSKQLGSKLRSQINKAQSHDLTIQFGGHELLNSFYQVFTRNMRDLGTPVYGKKLFSEILTGFPESAFIAIVTQNGVPLAAGFLLGYRDKLEIPWASSIKSKNYLGANMFMYRAILREAIARDYRYFDFGRSTRDASTHRFKKQWGAKEHQLHWHYWTRNEEQANELNPDNPKFRLAIMAWQKLPVSITKLIGPPLARILP